MKLTDIIPVLETIAPPEYAEEFDTGRIGDIINLGNDVEKIAVALDPTEYVLKRAADIDADLLITHHTLIFEPVTKIAKPFSNKLKIVLENDISLYSMHTNYDKVPGGVNDILANCLGLTDIEGLEIGRIGKISPCSTETFARHVSKSLDTHVQYVGDKKTIEKVMVFGGSGFRPQFLDIAHENDVDAFVSSELKHDVIRNRGSISLIDATHYATENPAMEKLCERLEELLKLDVEFIDHNPFINVV